MGIHSPRNRVLPSQGSCSGAEGKECKRVQATLQTGSPGPSSVQSPALPPAVRERVLGRQVTPAQPSEGSGREP